MDMNEKAVEALQHAYERTDPLIGQFYFHLVQAIVYALLFIGLEIREKR